MLYTWFFFHPVYSFYASLKANYLAQFWICQDMVIYMFCSSIPPPPKKKGKIQLGLNLPKDSEAKEKKKEMGTNISLYTITW